MNRCHCLISPSKQCTRDVSNKPSQNPKFCWQHQECINPIKENNETKNSEMCKIKSKTVIKTKAQKEILEKPKAHQSEKISQPETKNQFLDLFTYENREPPKQSGDNTVFHNCILLKPLDTFKVGDKVEAIGIAMQLFLWKDGEDFEEVNYIL